MMDNKQREILKQQIQQRITELDGLLSTSDDNTQAKQASTVDKQITANEKTELMLLKRNLRWLDSEDAGYCQKCDYEIPFARLHAVPTTRLCIQCAAQQLNK